MERWLRYLGMLCRRTASRCSLDAETGTLDMIRVINSLATSRYGSKLLTGVV
jgi:hypothetical protein